MLKEITTALGPGAIVLAKDTGGAPMRDFEVANTVMTSDTFCSSYCRGCDKTSPPFKWSPALRDDCVASMQTIANTSARGQISQSHAMGPMEDAQQREWGVACFLVGAGPLSFYSYADDGRSGGSWTMAGTRWWPEYEAKLGAPLDPPLKKEAGSEYVYVRRFSSGLSVRVDVDKHNATIVRGK
jgi:hypothetical protein